MSKTNGIETQDDISVTLSVYERIILAQHVLREGIGSFEEALVVLDMREDVELTEEERGRAKFRQVDGGTQWDDFSRDFEFDADEAKIIKMGLRLVDSALYSDRAWLSLVSKFYSREERKELLNDLREKRKTKEAA